MTSSLTAWMVWDPYEVLVSVQTSCADISARADRVAAVLGMLRSTMAVLLPGGICTRTERLPAGNAEYAAPSSQPCGSASSALTSAVAGSAVLIGRNTGSGTRFL